MGKIKWKKKMALGLIPFFFSPKHNEKYIAGDNFLPQWYSKKVGYRITDGKSLLRSRQVHLPRGMQLYLWFRIPEKNILTHSGNCDISI